MMVDLDYASEILSQIFLFLLVFGMSATVEFRNLVHQLKNKYALMTGIGMQFLIMPVLGFVSILAFGAMIPPSVGITLLVVTASPGGSYSNWFCSLFNADLALSVAMTAISTLLSSFLLPANLMLYSHLTYGGDKELMNSVDWKTLFITLAVVILAILSGLATSYFFRSRRFRVWANRFGTISGLLLVLFSITLSSADKDTRLWNQPWAFYVAVAFPCLVGLALANLMGSLAGLRKPERVTVAVECCYQNVGIATSVAVAMFDGTAQGNALCVPMFYGFVEAVTLGIYCTIAWKAGWTKAPPNERLCVIIGTSYEAGEGHHGGRARARDDADDKDTVQESLQAGSFDGSLEEDKPMGRVRLDTEEEVSHPSSSPGGGRVRLDTEEEIAHPSSSPGAGFQTNFFSSAEDVEGRGQAEDHNVSVAIR